MAQEFAKPSEIDMPNCILIGAPIDEGQRRAGCVMGPAAYRVAGLASAIAELGHGVEDWGDLSPAAVTAAPCGSRAASWWSSRTSN